MTLHELDVLIRRIEETLQRPQAGAVLSRLASEYQVQARAAAHRLNQCAAMLAAGDEHQALQLAETAPALLDQLTLLCFRRSPQWLALCRGENLPAPDAFDIKAIRRLNELYAKGIDKDHALYRDYRRAVMLNDDARALAILRSIVRLNPNDKNAKTEHDRLEQKIRADKLRQLEKLVHAKQTDATAISALADELEKAGVPIDSADAQSTRAKFLLDRLKASKDSWDEFERIYEKLLPLRGFLNTELRSTFDELERWGEGERVRRREIAGRRAAIDQLAAVVARVEQEQGVRHSAADLRAALDSLDRAWWQVEHFRADVSANLAASVHKLRDTLQTQIDRAFRTSRRLALAGVAAVVLICLAAAGVAYKRQAERALEAQIRTSIAARRVSETEAALPRLGHPAREAEAFVQRERALKSEFETTLAALEMDAQRGFTNEPPENIDARFTSAKEMRARLAPEFRTAAEAAFGNVESQWQQFLERQRTARTAQLLSVLEPLESAANRDLQYSLDPHRVAASAQGLKAQLDPAATLSRAALPALRPKQEAVFRLENLEARVDKFAQGATNFTRAQAALEAAANLTNYLGALQLLASSGFAPQGQRSAAAVVIGLNLSEASLLAPLLLPAAPEALREPPRAARYPEEVLPAEREIQRRLRDDENINNVSRVQIEVKTLPENDPRRQRTIFLRGELQRRVIRRLGQVYDPVESPTALHFVQREFGASEFNVEEPTPTPERELYERIGLARLLDSNTGKYQISLLQALDDLNQDRQASPVFRAWLFVQLCEIIDQQPVQWGSVWSPSFAKDRAALVALGVKQIHSGDWFVPSINSQRAPALVACFDRAALHSYAREASFYKRLLPRALESGIKIAGYVNAEGEPIPRSGGPALWGLAAADREPAVLIERGRVRTPPLAFTPLFVFAGNAPDLIDAALQAAGYSAAAVNLSETLPAILRTQP